MKQSILIGAILTALLLDVSGRTWTDQAGRKVGAEVARLDDDRTVTSLIMGNSRSSCIWLWQSNSFMI